MWLHAPNIKCVHGFSTRQGGFSPPPFDTMNLGGHEDDPLNISRNRAAALSTFQIQPDEISALRQVHGTQVCRGGKGFQEGDALVSDKTGVPLVVSIADCYPVLFYDEQAKVIGAAHAGWRGTVAGIVRHVIDAMIALGAKAGNMNVAIGQGISQKNFEVGNEVVEQFFAAAFPSSFISGKNIDLAACNKWLAKECGVPESNIWSMNRCTFEQDFFSYRRDNGRTGRMWGLIMMQG